MRGTGGRGKVAGRERKKGEMGVEIYGSERKGREWEEREGDKRKGNEGNEKRMREI